MTTKLTAEELAKEIAPLANKHKYLIAEVIFRQYILPLQKENERLRKMLKELIAVYVELEFEVEDELGYAYSKANKIILDNAKKALESEEGGG